MNNIEIDTSLEANSLAPAAVQHLNLPDPSPEAARDHFLTLWRGVFFNNLDRFSAEDHRDSRESVVTSLDDPNVTLIAARRFPNLELARQNNKADREITVGIEDKRQSVSLHFKIAEREIATYDFLGDPFALTIMRYFRLHLRAQNMHP